MPAFTFTPSPKSTADRDLLYLKTRVGGVIGELNTAGVKTAGVLKLGGNVYVTTGSPKGDVSVILSAGGADLHVVKSSADVTMFLKRWANFKRS